MKYDFLIVGAGLFGATFSYLATNDGYKCLVIDSRNHIGGACYTEIDDSTNIVEHKYGPHIFRTNDTELWDFVNSLSKFHDFVNSPVANYNGKIYNLPFNMNTFNKMWGCITPEQAKEIIEKQVALENITDPNANLETKALSLVGRDIYEILIKGYTEKQWGEDCKLLPADIITRLPVRYTYDNNYSNTEYQGIPDSGYTDLISRLLYGSEIRLNTTYSKYDNYGDHDKVIYTGRIDEYYDYRYGVLDYRGLRFERLLSSKMNYQGVPVMNYTSSDVPFTRVTEHKHFNKSRQYTDKYNILSFEYPMSPSEVGEDHTISYYPVNNERNNSIYNKYKDMKNNNVIFCGRAGEYKYYDMDVTMMKAKLLYNKLTKREEVL